MYKNLCLEALGISATENESIELALSHGFKGIDLDVVSFSRQAAERGVAHARRLIDSAKLKLGSFELPVDISAPDDLFRTDLARLAELASLAAELGCSRAVITLAPANDERPFHQNFEFHRKRLAEMATVLEAHRLQLGVGFDALSQAREKFSYQFICQLDPLLMLLNLVNKRNVGVLVDAWHLHLIGGGIAEISKLTKGQIVAVRLADFPKDQSCEACGEESRLLPGETGVIDSPGILGVLADKGYDGPVTPYPSSTVFAGIRRDEIAKRTGQAIDQVWKAAGLSVLGKRTGMPLK